MLVFVTMGFEIKCHTLLLKKCKYISIPDFETKSHTLLGIYIYNQNCQEELTLGREDGRSPVYGISSLSDP
jgi:hypothetical protein